MQRNDFVGLLRPLRAYQYSRNTLKERDLIGVIHSGSGSDTLFCSCSALFGEVS